MKDIEKNNELKSDAIKAGYIFKNKLKKIYYLRIFYILFYDLKLKKCENLNFIKLCLEIFDDK